MKRRPYWPSVTTEAFQPDNLPRVFASMGFDNYIGTVARGNLRWWRPEYIPLPSEAAVGSYSTETIRAYLVNRKAELSRINRAMRDSPVHMLALNGKILVVDEFLGDGAWRMADGSVRGQDLIELGAWRWKLPYDQAGARLAKVIGMTPAVLPTHG